MQCTPGVGCRGRQHYSSPTYQAPGFGVCFIQEWKNYNIGVGGGECKIYSHKKQVYSSPVNLKENQKKTVVYSEHKLSQHGENANNLSF